MERNNTNDSSQTQFPYKITKEISRLQVKPPNKFGEPYCKYVQAARRGTGCHGILGTCRAIRDCKSNISGRGTGPAYNDSRVAKPSKRLCVTKNRHNTVFATTLGPNKPGEIDPIASTTAAPAMLMT